MTKQRVETVLITFTLLFLSGVRVELHKLGFLPHNPWLAVLMLISTAIYLFGGCILQTFGHLKSAVGLGVVVFFVLCTALFYSICLMDYVTFFVCVAIVIRKSTFQCQCIKNMCGRSPLE